MTMYQINKKSFSTNPLFQQALDSAFSDFADSYGLSENETEVKLAESFASIIPRVSTAATQAILTNSRVAMQRASNNRAYDSIIDEKKLYQRLLQSHEFQLLDNLPMLTSDRSVDIKYSSCIILGSAFFASLEDREFLLSLQSRKITNILLIETSAQSFVQVLCHVDIPAIKNLLKEHGIGLDFIFEESLEIAQHLIYNKCVAKPYFMFGSYVIYDEDLDSSLLILKSWIFQPQGLTSRFICSFGYTTDEINQSIDGFANFTFDNRAVLQKLNQHDLPIAIVGSGPSLQFSLPSLKANQDKIFIVSAGSSIGPLLENGIRIDLNVVLERGDDTALDYIPLISKFPHLCDIPCFRSSTSSPSFNNIFKRNIFFHRPLSASFTLTLDEDYGTLPICGPESVNAAFDLSLALGFRNIYLLGADFSALRADHHRDPLAIGVSPRTLDLVERSNKGRTVYTDRTLIAARDALQSTYNLYSSSGCPVSLFRIGEGIPLAGESTVNSDLLDHLNTIENKSEFMSQTFKQMKYTMRDPDRINYVLDKFSSSVNSYFENLKAFLLKDNWSSQDRDAMSVLLQAFPPVYADESVGFEETIADMFVTRMYRQLSLFMLAVANDCLQLQADERDKYMSSVNLSIDLLRNLSLHISDQIRLKTLRFS